MVSMCELGAVFKQFLSLTSRGAAGRNCRRGHHRDAARPDDHHRLPEGIRNHRRVHAGTGEGAALISHPPLLAVSHTRPEHPIRDSTSARTLKHRPDRLGLWPLRLPRHKMALIASDRNDPASPTVPVSSDGRHFSLSSLDLSTPLNTCRPIRAQDCSHPLLLPPWTRARHDGPNHLGL